MRQRFDQTSWHGTPTGHKIHIRTGSLLRTAGATWRRPFRDTVTTEPTGGPEDLAKYQTRRDLLETADMRRLNWGITSSTFKVDCRRRPRDTNMAGWGEGRRFTGRSGRRQRKRPCRSLGLPGSGTAPVNRVCGLDCGNGGRTWLQNKFHCAVAHVTNVSPLNNWTI